MLYPCNSHINRFPSIHLLYYPNNNTIMVNIRSCCNN